MQKQEAQPQSQPQRHQQVGQPEHTKVQAQAQATAPKPDKNIIVPDYPPTNFSGGENDE